MHRALIDSGLRSGDWVVFPGGGGGVGMQGVMLAHAMGMRPIVVDGGKKKRDLSMEMGAEEFVDFTEVEDPVAEVKKIADGIGAHGVIVTAWQVRRCRSSIVDLDPRDSTDWSVVRRIKTPSATLPTGFQASWFASACVRF